MSDPFIGEVRAFTYSFVPYNWLACDGATYSVNQYQALYAVIGTLYGGDVRQQTFKVPNLNGAAQNGYADNKIAIGSGSGTPSGTNYVIGSAYGTVSATLGINQMPVHNHSVTTYISGSASDLVCTPSATTNLSRTLNQRDFYSPGTAAPSPDVGIPNVISGVGNGVAHENRQPFQTVLYCIAHMGIFPVRT